MRTLLLEGERAKKRAAPQCILWTKWFALTLNGSFAAVHSQRLVEAEESVLLPRGSAATLIQAVYQVRC